MGKYANLTRTEEAVTRQEINLLVLVEDSKIERSGTCLRALTAASRFFGSRAAGAVERSSI